MSFDSISLALVSGISIILGIFVVSQCLTKKLNILLGALSLAMSFWCFGQFMGAVVTDASNVLFWTRFNVGAAIFIPVLFFHFVLELTNEIKEKRGYLFVVYAMSMLFLISDFTRYFVASVKPSFSYKFYPTPGIAYPIFAIFLIIVFIYAFKILFDFVSKTKGEQNNQAKYVLLAAIIGFIGGATAFFPVFGINFPVINPITLPIYLILTIYAIVRHKLLDIRIVLREGIVYSAIMLLFAGFYALIILLANRLFKDLTRADEYTATAFVFFVSILVLSPLRSLLQELLDKTFFKGSYYYQKTINDLSSENLELYKRLLQSDKLASLGTIAAGMAHEIKNPLASIKGLTQILPENIDDAEFIEKYHDIVPRQLDRINKIVEDLLEFGQPSSMESSSFDICHELDSIIGLIGKQCEKLNIEIVKKFETCITFGDKEKLYQAFMNIILNAIQAMQNGGKLIVKTIDEGDRILVSVSDTGIGISEGQLQNIFDPFYTTKETGTGMGLAVTYRIIKEHDGEIEVLSQPGQGTTFKIWLYTKPRE